ncbi:MAG: pantoate--beta-alanine ligase [Candidatus Eremiobacteraeota bacterium]|nr:pantoate--beta-alanine ligase [Candidatus Eremiobacteraeota bacterium]
MIVVSSAEEARAALRELRRPLGLVPTMGSLHEGHLELVRSMRQSCASVAASVFVNPLQFGAGEDFERYPRDLEADAARLEAEGVDVLFAPSAQEIYPPGFSTAVDPGPIAAVYEGGVRPSHFRGVATVVAKLLNVVQPNKLCLGQKDAQQTAVLRSLVRDLVFPVQVTIVPTVREADGLALSSRNLYLSAAERTAAPSLHAALVAMLQALRDGETVQASRDVALRVLDPSARLDYLDLVNADTFEPIAAVEPPAFAIGAARFGATRLIDNLWITA